MVKTRIVDNTYGTQNASVTDAFSDSLNIYADILTDAGEVWRKLIEEQIAKCDRAAMYVGLLSSNLAKAAGGTGDESTRSARERYYDRIDAPFRQWIESINPSVIDAERDSKIDDWRKTAMSIAYALGEELVDEAGTAAFVGRTIEEEIKGKKQKIARHYSSAEAYDLFRSEIYRIYNKGVI